ncbi:MAG: FAD-dependent oxidoreductase [Candidatus Neomarinimicrobiota bacterium]|jgi:L-aspartate oxidase
MKSAEPFSETDVLVIGSGLAGCAASYAAAQMGLQVILLSINKDSNLSSSYQAQGGIIYRNPQDTYKDFLDDFQRTGADLVNEKMVKTVYENGPRLIDEILINDLKVPFDRTETGEIALTREGSHIRERIAFVKDYTGRAILERFYDRLKQVSNIEILPNTTCVDLITLAHHSLDSLHIYEPSTCAGAYVYFQDSDETHPILAKMTILASGGLGRLYLHTSNPHHARGDGYAMAYRAGARLMNMEYIQFHPTTLFSTDDERFLISEAVRGEGGILRNKYGEDFMPLYHPLGSLAPRDIVARSIMQEISRTGTPFVYLDITHKSTTWLKQRFPQIYEKCLAVKVDMATEGIPVVPAAHYECGGVAVDGLGNTTIRRLKVVGEVACTGLHGANRLASSSLLECLVFGTLTGRDCLERIRQDEIIMPAVALWKEETEPLDPDLFQQDRLTIKHTMWNYVGIVRTARKLERAGGILWRLQRDVEKFYAHSQLNDETIGLRNAATTSMLILHAARLNKTSRGCHYRID